MHALSTQAVHILCCYRLNTSSQHNLSQSLGIGLPTSTAPATTTNASAASASSQSNPALSTRPATYGQKSKSNKGQGKDDPPRHYHIYYPTLPHITTYQPHVG